MSIRATNVTATIISSTSKRDPKFTWTVFLDAAPPHLLLSFCSHFYLCPANFLTLMTMKPLKLKSDPITPLFSFPQWVPMFLRIKSGSQVGSQACSASPPLGPPLFLSPHALLHWESKSQAQEQSWEFTCLHRTVSFFCLLHKYLWTTSSIPDTVVAIEAQEWARANPVSSCLGCMIQCRELPISHKNKRTQ